MKITKVALSLALVAGTLASGAALADRGHGGWGGRDSVRFGINLGVPLGPWYYPPYYAPYYSPYYAPYYPPYPAVVPVQPSAPVYVEKGADAAGPSASSSSYWYYCTDPQGYYPYINDCPNGWMKVVPQSPAEPGPR